MFKNLMDLMEVGCSLLSLSITGETACGFKIFSDCCTVALTRSLSTMVPEI